LEAEKPEHVVRINPEDLSLPYITDLGAIRFLNDLNVHLDPLFIALWKHVLLVELIRRRYKVDSPAAKQNFLSQLRERIRRDPSKRAALDYLDEFEGKFWCEADERVREITQKFQRQVDSEVRGTVALAELGEVQAGTERLTSLSGEVRAEQAERFQRIVNETQLARLNKMINVLDEDILDSQHFTYVVVDDLDRDWVDESVANDLIRCLFRTVIDLKRVASLKVLVALRTNIFEQLNFGTRTGGQEEKFRSLELNMRWTRRDLERMLDERARIAAEAWGLSDIKAVRDLLPPANKTRGKPLDYILDRTLLRPRDAIAFVNECLSAASGKRRVAWVDIRAAEVGYSRKRLLALRDEWKHSYPGIDKVFDLFRGAPVPMSRDEFQVRLDDAMLLPSDHTFPGVRWMTELSEPMWSASGDGDWADLYRPLVKLLYQFGLIGCSRSSGGPVVYAYEDPDFTELPTNLDSSCCFHIHPAFRTALDVSLRIGHKHEGVARMNK
jgi:hypothetical protein